MEVSVKRVRTGPVVAGAVAVSIALIAGCSSGSRQPFTDTQINGADDGSTEQTLPVAVVEGGSAPYKLAVAGDGSNTRFNSCSGPIRILLNPGDLQEKVAAFTDVDAAAQLGELFTQYAQELSDATGLEIVYGGITDIGLDLFLTEEQVIVFNFGSVGFPGQEDSYFEGHPMYGTQQDGWIQILNYQHFENSNGFSIHYEEAAKLAGGSRDVGIDEAGKRWLKTALGLALGLMELDENDMVEAGIPPEQHAAQVMYADSHQEQNGAYNLTWGDGDKAGLAAVGASNPCFTGAS